MGEVFAGRYEFVDVLGHGGMGTVWRVWDVRDGAYRAAKVLKQSDSASLLRFVRETGTRVDHDHVVAPTGWSAEDDRVLFTMPLITGGSVATLLADYGALPADWVKELGLQLLDALAAVHQAGLVHRDVKPGNLLLEATGRGTPHLRLSDFGIAASPDEPRLTRATEAVHTPGYSSPEAIAGADPEPGQDLYSVGMVMREMLTGDRPDPRGAIAVGDGPLEEIASRLTTADVTSRFSSVAEARATLQAVTIATSSQDEPIEVFDQLPEFPEGWGSGGPVPTVRRRMPRIAEPDPMLRLRIVAGGLAFVGLVCVVVAVVLAF